MDDIVALEHWCSSGLATTCAEATVRFAAELGYEVEGLVGAWRFELQTSCAQGRRATRLRYAPKVIEP